jgi:uncharacterized protein (DUF885 family)
MPAWKLPLLAVCLALVTTACSRSPEPAQAPAAADATSAPARDPWSTFRDAFIEASLKADPPFAVSAGRHEFDGQFPDWSTAGLAAEGRRLTTAREAALKFDASALSDAQRFERDYIVARIDNNLFWLQVAEQPWTNPTWYLGGIDPSVYLTRDYAPLADRMRAFITYQQGLPAALANIRANLRTPMPQTFVERGVSAFNGFADYFEKDVPQVFASITDTALQSDFAASNKAAAAAARDLGRYFESLRPTATQDFALGAGKFAKMLAMTEQVTTPLAELEKIGRADLERNLAAMRTACARFAPGQSLIACQDQLKLQFPPTDGPVAEATAQLGTLRGFVLDRGVVTIPSEELALVAEAPPYNRANAAYIEIPGPFEKELPAVYYIAPPDPSWTKEEQLAYIPAAPDLLFTSVHEVWPGHFLNFLHAKESDSMIGRLFVGYAFAEGWAHYTEELMWEMGLNADDAATHIGQLSNALLRDVRFLSAIGLHTGGMTVAQSERMFVEQGLQDIGNARQQAARGTYDPAYLNYTMGKLMIYKLRADWTASRGGKAAWKQFHDEFLSYGGPPIPMVRKAMLGNAEGGLF